MVRKLSSAFVDIVNSDSDRQFLVSTHSEHFVQALLEKVAQGEIHEDDVKIYHLTMGDKGTQIELQKVNSKGQIEGGLSHFYEAELSGLKNIFKLTD
jgi:predicted ATPase